MCMYTTMLSNIDWNTKMYICIQITGIEWIVRLWKTTYPGSSYMEKCIGSLEGLTQFVVKTKPALQCNETLCEI